jgi:hypothetical protein
VELAHHLGERRLGDLLGGVGVVAEAREREAVQAGEVEVEELAERPLVAAQHALDELTVGLVGVEAFALHPGCD